MSQPLRQPRPGGDVDQPLWDALRTVEAPATIAELQERAGGFRHQSVSRRLRHWASIGLADETPARPTRYKIRRVDMDRVEAPTRGELSEVVWRALKRLGGEATYAEILAATGESDRAVYCRLFRWIHTGYLDRVQAEPVRYSIACAALAEPVAPRKERPTSKPRKGATARSRVWIAMRVLRTFDVPLLMMTAEVPRRPCEDLISGLGRAGYIRVVAHRMRRCKPGGGGFARSFTTYQLVRNTGPKCPILACPLEGGRRLIDRNTGERIDLFSRRRPKDVRQIGGDQ